MKKIRKDDVFLIFVRADTEAPYSDITTVMKLVIEAGYEEISLLAQRRGQ